MYNQLNIPFTLSTTPPPPANIDFRSLKSTSPSPSIPNEKNEEAVETAGGSIMSTLKNALSGGRIKDVLGFFKNGRQGSPELVQEATDNYANDLQTKLGVAPAEANKAAAALVPQTM